MIKAVFFDLDGTLLPLDQDVFLQTYFKGLVTKLAPRGYEPKAFMEGLWQGIGAMLKNDGSRTNLEAFWDGFSAGLGPRVREDEPVFDAFYREEFQAVRQVCGYDPGAARAVALVKERGCKVVLATNPLFPAIATQSRIRWAGLEPSDFDVYTTYENSCYAKPNPAYYQEILGKLALRPEECIMVGNDVGEDMVTRELGMEVFLLTDHLINQKNADISQYPHGGFPELLSFLQQRL